MKYYVIYLQRLVEELSDGCFSEKHELQVRQFYCDKEADRFAEKLDFSISFSCLCFQIGKIRSRGYLL